MKINIITKFLLKLMFLTFILLLSVVLDNKSIINLSKIKTILEQNINIINITKKVNGKLNIIDLGDNIINVSLNDSTSKQIDTNKYLYKQKSSKIYSTVLGSVIKINNLPNERYEVVILDENNRVLTYSNLKEVNVNIYQIIKVNDLIGVASVNNDINNTEYLYSYLLYINEN